MLCFVVMLFPATDKITHYRAGVKRFAPDFPIAAQTA
jgi:hypothetical protein